MNGHSPKIPAHEEKAITNTSPNTIYIWLYHHSNVPNNRVLYMLRKSSQLISKKPSHCGMHNPYPSKLSTKAIVHTTLL